MRNVIHRGQAAIEEGEPSEFKVAIEESKRKWKWKPRQKQKQKQKPISKSDTSPSSSSSRSFEKKKIRTRECRKRVLLSVCWIKMFQQYGVTMLSD